MKFLQISFSTIIFLFSNKDWLNKIYFKFQFILIVLERIKQSNILKGEDFK